MKNMTKLYLALILSFFMMVTAEENTRLSNSIALSTDRFETKNAYMLELHIEGIKSDEVKIRSIGQKLVILVRQRNPNGNAMSGTQVINYSFTFNDDAFMGQLSRKNSKNKISISIPKY